jgi:hypothetical protein
MSADALHPSDFVPPCAIPTLEDWESEPADPDSAWAYDQLFGLCGEEVDALRSTMNELSVAEDIFATPSRVFRYYIWPHMAYLVSPASVSQPDSACAFPGQIAWRAEHQPEDIRPLWPVARRVLEFIADNHERYDASPDIYGDLHAKCAEAIERVERALN